MADDAKGVGKTKKSRVLVRNLMTQPREYKIGGKWYRWNAFGTKGDTLDMTGVDMLQYGNFETRSVE